MRKKRILLVLCLMLAMLAPGMSGFFGTTVASVEAAQVDPTLAKVTAKLRVGKTGVLKIKNLPEGSKVAWKSSAPTVLKVKKNAKLNGRVKALKVGKATLTCRIKTPKNQKYTLTCTVTVRKALQPEATATPTPTPTPVAATNPAASIRISNATPDSGNNAFNIVEGQNFTFQAEITAKDTTKASTDQVFWSIDDTSVATVSDAGTLTPVKAGTTTLHAWAGKTKAEAMAGSVKADMPICVKSKEVKVTGVTLCYSTRLAVSFDQPVKADSLFDAGTKVIRQTAVTITGKVVNGQEAKAVGTLTGSLSEDLKTLFIDNTNEYKGTYTVVVTNQAQSEAGIALTAYSADVELVDKMGPTYEGSSMDESGTTCIVKFNEPVDLSKLMIQNVVKRNGQPLFGGTTEITKVSNYKLAADKKSLSIDLSSLISADQNCEIQADFYGLTDLSGNVSQKYPCTIILTTNTTNKVEAKCTQIYRNGKSLVAIFDQSLQTAGTATVNGMTLTGIVNPDNKKTGIYYMEEGGLQGLSGTQSVTVNGFSVFSSTAANNTYTASVNFNQAGTTPEVKSAVFTSKTVNGVKKTILQLTFDKSVKVEIASGNLSANVVTDGTVGTTNSYAYTAAVDGAVVSLELTGTFIGGSTYNFTIPSGMVTDYYHNANNQKTVSAKKDASDSTALPGPVHIQLSSSNKKLVYVTFNTMVDMASAQTVGNYTISGLTITNATLVANTAGSPAVVELTLSTELSNLGVPYQVTIKNILGYKGEYSAMNEYKELITLGQNQTFDVVEKVVYSGENKVILSFSSNVNAGSKVNYQFMGQGNKAYTLKGSPVIKDNTITFVFNETFVQGQTITFTPASDNEIFDANKNYLLNVSQVITIY